MRQMTANRFWGPTHRQRLVARDGVAAESRVVRSPSERGYALIGLIALATIIAIAATAAAPNLRQQKQRELEEEAIFRGEQVAEAIRLYYTTFNRLPTSLDQLLEGVPQGTKKARILRPSATIDPLTGEPWRLVAVNDQALAELRDAIVQYNGGLLPPTRDPRLQPLVAQVLTLINTGGNRAPASSRDETSGPFVGVASRSRRASIITYYGLERHDRWVFTPLFR